MSNADVALFVDPLSHHFERDRLFELATAGHAGADILAPYVYLREWMGRRGVSVHTADLLDDGTCAAERNVYVSMGMRHRFPSIARRGDTTMSAFFALECPIVEPALYSDLHDVSRAFRRTYSYSSEEALRPFLREPVSLCRFCIPQSFDAVHERIWGGAERGFLTIINSNKRPRLQTAELYSERLRAIEFFERTGEIDLFGMGWDVPPYLLGRAWIPTPAMRTFRAGQAAWHHIRTPPLLAAARRAYRGQVADKAAALGRYRFAICFENMVLDGWITEKLFDCVFSGTVPVYLGAPDIERWVPAECFIDMRRFDGFAELREFLHALGPEEIEAYREAGRDFVTSELFRPFSRESFARVFGALVEEDAGVVLDPMLAAAGRT